MQPAERKNMVSVISEARKNEFDKMTLALYDSTPRTLWDHVNSMTYWRWQFIRIIQSTVEDALLPE